MTTVSCLDDLPPAYECHLSDSIILPTTSKTQLPPEYARQDPDVRSFSLQAPFISAAPVSLPTAAVAPLPLPRYQLSQLRSSLGKPYKLSLRRLTATESRRASIISTLSSGSTPRQHIDFDDDLVVYEISNTAALHRFSAASANVQIVGCKARALKGHIELAELSKRTGSCRFWHNRRKADAAIDATQGKMRKWGYKPEDEWNRNLLFDVGAASSASHGHGRPWKDEGGTVLAIESGSDLKFVGMMDQPMKEALLACWATRRWVLNQLEWMPGA